MLVDTVVATLASALLKEGARTIVMIFAIFAFITFPFQVVLAQQFHASDCFSARGGLASAAAGSLSAS